ncbi:Ig-like domain-containing protein (plasmid) [Burkholderia aenigmatica]|uniref:Ig-like domain-containing protein n=1 Tax=Burkholderia aenigmatica TaxID=2015348 RepID=UPI003B436D01
MTNGGDALIRRTPHDKRSRFLGSWIRKIGCAIALSAASFAHAALVQYNFTSVDGVQKTSGPDAGYANAAGQMTFSISSGLANRVRISILTTNQQIVSTATSDVVGVNSTFTIGGKTYYGAQLQLPAPIPGAYVLQADILDGTGKVISTDKHQMIEATSGPKVGAFVGSGHGICYDDNFANLCQPADGALVGPWTTMRIGVNGVTDNGAGVAGAKFSLKSPDGLTTYTQQQAQYDAGNQLVLIGDGSTWIAMAFTPEDFIGPVVAEFDIFDNAGNVSVVRRNLIWNGEVHGPKGWSIAAIYNPNSTANFLPGSPFVGYEPYTPGMTTYANPVKYVIRAPRDEWITNAATGWFIAGTAYPGSMAPDYQDSQYGYKLVTVGFSQSGNVDQSLYWASKTVGQGDSLNYQLKLGDGVRTTPSITGFLYSLDSGQLSVPVFTPHYMYSKRTTISQITANAEVRDFDQVVEDNIVTLFGTTNAGTQTFRCTIPAGATSCVLTGPFVMDASGGATTTYMHYTYIRSADGALQSGTLTVPVFVIDKGVPQITSVTYDPKALSITVVGTKATVGAPNTWADLRVQSIAISATPATGGKAVSIPVNPTFANTLFTGVGDGSSLPDGNYDFVVTVTDSAGNVTSQDVGTYLIAKTPSSIGFSVQNGAAVKSLDSILISITDPNDPAPMIQSASLTGGPTKTDVQVATRATDTPNQYGLTYPMMFPSSDANSGYTLTVSTMNKFGRQNTATLNFLYSPPQVSALGLANGVARLPAVPQVVTNIRSSPLTLSNGGAVTGQYPVMATLRADSTIPLVVNGVTVAPGATQAVASSYDFTRAGSALNVPVSPATADLVGRAYLLLSTVAPNAPVLVAEVDTWSPSQQIALAPAGKATSFTVDVAPVTLVATQTGVGTDCTGSIEYALQSTISSRGGTLNPGGYQCALQVDTDDGDLIDYTTSPQGIVGYLHTVGQNRAVYESGVLYRDPTTNKIGFYTAGKQTINLVGTSLDDAAPVWSYLAGNGPQAAGSSMTNPVAMLGVNQYAGQMKATAVNPGLTMVMTDPSNKATKLATQSNSIGGQIYTTNNTLWDKLRYGFDVSYTRRPDKVWHADLNLSVQPPNVTINLNRQVGSLVSTTDATLTGTVGMLQGGAFTYSVATMGEWRVQAYVKTVTRSPSGVITSTKLEPLSDAPTAVRPDGSFTLPVGQLPSGTANIVVKAILFDSNGPTTRSVSTTDLLLAVSNGSPIPASLVVAQATSGVVSSSAAFVPALNVIYDSKRLQDIGTIHWSVSADSGATWQSAGDTTSPGLRPRISSSGTYQYKAVVTNKYSGLTSDTNTVTVEAFQRPTLSISGATAGYAGSPVTWTAVSDVADTSFTWSVKTAYNDQNPKTFTGKTVTYTPQTAGTLWVTLTGQESTGTIANPLRTRTASAIYSVAALSLPKPIITGQHVLETGKPATFTVTQNSPFNKNQVTTQTLKGQWLLPDGTTQDGFDPVTVSIQPGQTTIGYVSWVDGLKDASLTKSGFTFSTWTYQFPKMVLAMSMPDTRAPAIGVFTANYENMADARNVGTEKFNFDWLLPSSANVTSQRGATLGATFTQAGEQQVQVTVSDARGNHQTLSKVFTVGNAPTLSATLGLQGSDRWSRAPSNVQAVLSLTSMPKGDQISQIVYALDGTPALTATNPTAAAVIPVATPGEHTISATITTKTGASFTASRSFSLVTGDNPVCSIAQSGSTVEIVLRAACTVNQGKVVGISWLVNGEKTALSSAFITFTGQQLAALRTAGVIATTDKGQTGQTSWTRP